jgi:hypothetical protein
MDESGPATDRGPPASFMIAVDFSHIRQQIRRDHRNAVWRGGRRRLRGGVPAMLGGGAAAAEGQGQVKRCFAENIEETKI